MQEDIRHSARNVVSGVAALVLLGGAALGLLIFGLMVLTSYPYGNYEFTLIGIAGIGGILAGMYCFFRPYA